MSIEGDGAGSLIEAWASRDRDRIAILLWNLTLDQTKANGSTDLTRTVRLSLPGVDPTWQVTVTSLAPGLNVKGGSGDLAAEAAALEVGDWPTDEQWVDLAERSKLRTEPVDRDGDEVTLTLAMPAAVLVEVRPGR
jgi:xylan 1,4-beta-xylosidase